MITPQLYIHDSDEPCEECAEPGPHGHNLEGDRVELTPQLRAQLGLPEKAQTPPVDPGLPADPE